MGNAIYQAPGAVDPATIDARVRAYAQSIGLATTSQLPDLTPYATHSELTSALVGKQSAADVMAALAPYAKTDAMNLAIAAGLVPYETQAQLSAALASYHTAAQVANDILSALASYVTVAQEQANIRAAIPAPLLAFTFAAGTVAASSTTVVAGFVADRPLKILGYSYAFASPPVGTSLAMTFALMVNGAAQAVPSGTNAASTTVTSGTPMLTTPTTVAKGDRVEIARVATLAVAASTSLNYLNVLAQYP